MTSSKSAVITADGKSPLSRYVSLLISVPRRLRRAIDRDAEAIRILTSSPPLLEAIRRADRTYWDRRLQKQKDRVFRTSRIWTRRDERRVLQRPEYIAYQEGPFWTIPAPRTTRHLLWLAPATGPSVHDQWFRRAVDEARIDGTASVLCPKLEETRTLFSHLIELARSISHDDGGLSEFDEASVELGSLACDLMDWTKAPSSTATPHATPDSSRSAAEHDGTHGRRKKRATTSGEAAAKVLAGLNRHHQYEHGSCLNLEPIQVNEFADTIAVSSGSVSGFLKKKFGDYCQYRRACAHKDHLINALKLLNGDVTPRILFNSLGDSDNDFPAA